MLLQQKRLHLTWNLLLLRPAWKFVLHFYRISVFFLCYDIIPYVMSYHISYIILNQIIAYHYDRNLSEGRHNNWFFDGVAALLP